MKVRYIAVGGVALLSLVGAAAADEQDEEVRQLNLEQLERNGNQPYDGTDEMSPDRDDEDWDGTGGPEYSSPPGPDDDPYTDDDGNDDEGMPEDDGAYDEGYDPESDDE